MGIFDSFTKKREAKYNVLKPQLCFFNINEEYQKRTEALRANKPATYTELTSPKTEEPKVEPVNEAAVKPEAEQTVKVNYEVVNNDVVDKADIVDEKVVDVPNEAKPDFKLLLEEILKKNTQNLNPEDMKDPVKAREFVKNLINDFVDISFDRYLDSLIEQKNFNEFKQGLMGSLGNMTTGGTIPGDLAQKLIDDANALTPDDIKDKVAVRAKIKALVNTYTDAMLDQSAMDLEDTAETPLKEDVVGTKKVDPTNSRTNYIGEILLKYIDLNEMNINLDQTQYTDYPFANRTYNLKVEDKNGTRYYSIDDGSYIPNRIALMAFHPTLGLIAIPLSKKTKTIVTSLLQTVRPLNDEEFNYVRMRYYMPDMAIYPNIDMVGNGAINKLTDEQKMKLDANLKQIFMATAIENGFIRYRFEKFKDVDNFVLVSDRLVSNPDPINIPMVIANLRVKFENGAMSTEMLQ